MLSGLHLKGLLMLNYHGAKRLQIADLPSLHEEVQNALFVYCEARGKFLHAIVPAVCIPALLILATFLNFWMLPELAQADAALDAAFVHLATSVFPWFAAAFAAGGIVLKGRVAFREGVRAYQLREYVAGLGWSADHLGGDVLFEALILLAGRKERDDATAGAVWSLAKRRKRWRKELIDSLRFALPLAAVSAAALSLLVFATPLQDWMPGAGTTAKIVLAILLPVILVLPLVLMTAGWPPRPKHVESDLALRRALGLPALLSDD